MGTNTVIVINIFSALNTNLSLRDILPSSRDNMHSLNDVFQQELAWGILSGNQRSDADKRGLDIDFMQVILFLIQPVPLRR